MQASNQLIAYYTGARGVELKRLDRQLRDGGDMNKRFQQYISHLRENPKLETCTPDSHKKALLDCVSLDLWPGKLGHMYVIPFGKTATAIPGYKGLIRLLRRNGIVTKISANVVYSNEPFEYDAGTIDEIEHTPLPPKMRGEPVAVYAIAHYRHGPPQPVLLWWEEVMAIKAQAPGARKSDSPWNGPPNHVAEMAKKTAIRRLAKVVGEDDPQLAAAVALMDRTDGYNVTVDEKPVRRPTSADLLEHARSYAVDQGEVIDAETVESDAGPEPDTRREAP